MFPVVNQQEPPQRATIATGVWTRRLVILLTILAAIILAGVLLWGTGHMIASLLILALAALNAYTIVPAVGLLRRVMPGALAVLVIYLIALLLYLIINSTVTQLTALAHSLAGFLTSGTRGESWPLVPILKR
jgi:predicted PurR-regulated permease PerM